ncbi:cytochrome d ubiquinol oxidase subunit II [Sphingomonas trueperi]|uniref:cytochrome d ubiquinol oxidase subunit II n=1 Tax=Sphingomonas trueperi TaxID=53317 RepID=UPI000EB4BA0C
MLTNPDLATVWACIIAFAIFAYVVMDGFDLGIGILFPTLKVGAERDQAMNSIAPVWDGNETWLVMGGGGLMAAFPLAYAVILPATYPLVIAMLLGLVFRGVAFEYRWRDPRHRPAWDLAFCIGSVVATFAQGVMLGAVLQGIHVVGRAYAGGSFDWLTPFSLLTGVSLLAGYAMLAASWLIGKTHGQVQDQARRMAFRLGILTIIAMAAVSLATPFLAIDYWHRWLRMPGVLFTAQVPLATAIVTVLFFWSLKRARERLPFLVALGMFGLGFIGLGISMFPYVVPRALTIWDTAAPQSSQIFMLVGAVFILPLILGYTGWAYYVFRGKTVTEGYH